MAVHSIGKPGPAFGESADEAALDRLMAKEATCERCELYRHATQAVPGEGRMGAVMLVGEQPGDSEDLTGKPFVGPAGRLLDRCLDEAGIDRARCYVTNAVKHFKFERRGKKRLHARPNNGEVQACAWWLGAEIKLVDPPLIVALGATALYALMGRSAAVMRQRGAILSAPGARNVLVTIHPSLLLRMPDRTQAELDRVRFIEDLRKILPFLAS